MATDDGKRATGGDSRTSEMRKAIGELHQNRVVVADSASLDSLTSRGFGTLEGKQMVLSHHEALFLHGKGLLDVFKGKTKKPLGFQALLHLFERVDDNVWMKYLVYRDLRSRGYVVREGFGLGIDFRVYERGEYRRATAPYLVFGVQEGKPVVAKQLASVLRHVQGLKKTLVLAVVNRRGEVVYYTLSKLTMNEL